MVDCVSDSSSAAALKFSNLAVASKALSGPKDKERVLGIDMAVRKRSISVKQLNSEVDLNSCVFSMNLRRFFHWTNICLICNMAYLAPKSFCHEHND